MPHTLHTTDETLLLATSYYGHKNWTLSRNL